MKHLNVLALTKYGRLGASSRMRSWQYLPCLEQGEIEVTAHPLISDERLQGRYASGGYGLSALVQSYGRRILALRKRQNFDAIWIEKEALPWTPLWMERGLLRGVPYVLDYDDAIFHNYDHHRSPWVRRAFGRRLDGLMAGSMLVVCGNSYLAQRAFDAGARWVEILPTTIDLARYPDPSERQRRAPACGVTGEEPPRIVWIGSPSTVRYLQLLREPLQALAARRPFKLRVIGGGALDLPGVQVEVSPWSEATEVAAISACDVGVMPLQDSIWERGKCGYKLIQYMACGLPVVASPVGVNVSIVRDGENGFLAESPQQWVDSLERLLFDPDLRAAMGRAGRCRVEDEFCLQVTAPRLADLLRRAARQ